MCVCVCESFGNHKMHPLKHACSYTRCLHYDYNNYFEVCGLQFKSAITIVLRTHGIMCILMHRSMYMYTCLFFMASSFLEVPPKKL